MSKPSDLPVRLQVLLGRYAQTQEVLRFVAFVNVLLLLSI